MCEREGGRGCTRTVYCFDIRLWHVVTTICFSATEIGESAAVAWGGGGGGWAGCCWKEAHLFQNPDDFKIYMFVSEDPSIALIMDISSVYRKRHFFSLVSIFLKKQAKKGANE